MTEYSVSNTIEKWLAGVLGRQVDLSETQRSEERIRRAYAQYLNGYRIRPQDLIVVVDEEFPPGGVVEQSAIPFYSMCAHHFLPFWGVATVRYWPAGRLIGIGKLPRLIHCFSARLTLQEHIARDVAEFLRDAVSATRAEVDLEARHLCVEGRGPGAIGSITKCSFSATKPDCVEHLVAGMSNAKV
jgi:GTP cyclohydrolase IA